MARAATGTTAAATLWRGRGGPTGPAPGGYGSGSRRPRVLSPVESGGSASPPGSILAWSSFWSGRGADDRRAWARPNRFGASTLTTSQIAPSKVTRAWSTWCPPSATSTARAAGRQPAWCLTPTGEVLTNNHVIRRSRPHSRSATWATGAPHTATGSAQQDQDVAVLQLQNASVRPDRQPHPSAVVQAGQTGRRSRYALARAHQRPWPPCKVTANRRTHQLTTLRMSPRVKYAAQLHGLIQTTR